MAGTVMRTRAWLVAVAALVVVPASPPAAGGGAGDPFTPPQRLRAAGPAAADEARLASEGTASHGLGGLRVGARPAALIDGAWIAQGARVRGASLVAVGLQEAHLRHPDGRVERLSLSPDVQRTTRPAARANSSVSAAPKGSP